MFSVRKPVTFVAKPTVWVKPQSMGKTRVKRNKRKQHASLRHMREEAVGETGPEQ